MPEIISRKEAKALGLKRYFTGKPCKWGHVAERIVFGECTECQKKSIKKNNERRRALYRKSKKYRTLCAERSAVRYRSDPKKIIEKVKKWQRKNLAKVNQKSAKWRALNPDKRKETVRKYGRYAYFNGPKGPPKGETQWLRKNRVQLRNVRRHLRNRHREQSQSFQAET